MAFTSEQLALLEEPFLPHEHDFVGGNIYLRKSAIRHRLNQVDPDWELHPPELLTEAEDVVTLRGGLTLCGVTRFAIGTGIVRRAELKGFELAREISKARKAADSDLLARCAGKFGIGDYLKDMTLEERKSVRNPQALAAWLAKRFANGENGAGLTDWRQNGDGIKTLEWLNKHNLDGYAAAAELLGIAEPDITLFYVTPRGFCQAVQEALKEKGKV
jgi:hypothetical protein